MASDISIKFGVEGEGSFKSALSACEASIRSLNAEFKNVVSGGQSMEAQEKVLGQTSEALKSKIGVLTSEYDKQKSKLSDLAKAVEQAKSAEGDNAEAVLKAENAYNKQVKVVADLSTKLNKAETDLNNTAKSMDELKNGTNEATDAMEGAGGGISSLVDKLGGFKGVMMTAVVAAAAAGAAALVDFGKSALNAFADYEQLIGGVETLFDAANVSVESFAKTNNMSLEDAEKALAKYGNQTEVVLKNAQNAYKTAGLSTNEYMETVTSFSASLISSLGEYSYQAANYADMAIQDMADNANKMGSDISTIQNAYQGFAKQNYTMLDNLKLGFGGTKTEMERLLREAEKIAGYQDGILSVESFADIVDAIHIVQTEMGITGTTALEAGSTITGSINMTKAAWENFATALGTGDGINEAIQNVADSVTAVLSNVLPVIETIIMSMADSFPQFLEMGIGMVNELLAGLSEKLPDLIPKAIELVTTLTTTILSNIPMLIQIAWQLITALGTGLINAAPLMIENAGQVMSQLIQTIKDSIQSLIDGALNWGRDMIDSFIKGIKDRINALKNAVKSVAQTVKSILGFSEPKEGPLSNFHTYAPDMMELFAKGIYDNIDKVRDASNEAAGAVGMDFQTAKMLMGSKGTASANGNMHLTIQIGNQTIYDAYNAEVVRNGRNMVTV